MTASSTPELRNTLGQQAIAARAHMAMAPAADMRRAWGGLAALLRANVEPLQA